MPSPKMLANAIRALSMDAVQKAKSGHPGAPMGMADIAQVLYCDSYSITPRILAGQTETDSLCLMDMAQCYLTHYYI